MLRIALIVGLCANLAACANMELAGRATASPSIDRSEFSCLQEAIYFEAGNSGPDGQAAVAHVIMNRVADPRFPGSVCEVVTEGQEDGRCQFSYRCILDFTEIRWPSNHEKAAVTATRVLTDEVEDPTKGALFFHAQSMPPGWFNTLKKIGNFGGNIFYR